MDIAMPARMMRLWAARTRIACFLAVIMPFAVFARTILVPPQPVSPYLDTEVSTNCVLHKSRIDARTFDVHFQFEGTPTNNLEVAFGRDSNTNGVLDVQEIDTVYGWRGGRYFIENVRAWERIGTVAATNALCGVLSTSTWRMTRSWFRGVSRPRVAARRRSRSLQHRRPGFSAATGCS